MTPTSQVAAPPDAKGRRIHLGDSVGQREVDGRRGERGGTDTRKADEASERHEGTSDGDQREQTTGHRVVGAGRVGGKHTQTPTTAADRQPDGKKGRLKIDLGPSLADASEDVDGASHDAPTKRERTSRGGRKAAQGRTERRSERSLERQPSDMHAMGTRGDDRAATTSGATPGRAHG